ncbi:MAG: YybH family protein [Candidatus Hodarchaeota archaeon]
MKSQNSWFTFHLTALSFILVLVACQPAADSLEADREAIRKVIDALGTAITTNDVEGVMSLYADDAILMPPNQAAIVGKEAMRSWQETVFETHSFEFKIDSKEIVVDGDLAFSRGTLNLTVTSKTDGESFSSEGKYIVILRRQNDGSWKATHDIWNDTPAKDVSE